MTDSPRSRFRLPHWGWFFLATVGLVIVGIGLSVWLPYRREQRVVQMIDAWGGKVEMETGGPNWLRQLVGEERARGFKVFEQVNNVELKGAEITDADVNHLNGLKSLQLLSLKGTAITDSGLAHLSRLKSLEYLTLDDTAVGDSGMIHLSGLKNLRLIYLGGTALTDAGLPHLSGLKNLQWLWFDGTKVTDKAIKELQIALPDCAIEH